MVSAPAPPRIIRTAAAPVRGCLFLPAEPAPSPRSRVNTRGGRTANAGKSTARVPQRAGMVPALCRRNALAMLLLAIVIEPLESLQRTCGRHHRGRVHCSPAVLLGTGLKVWRGPAVTLMGAQKTDVPPDRATHGAESGVPAEDGETPGRAQASAGILVLSGVPLLWGTYAPAIRLLYELPHAPPGVLINAASLAVSAASLAIAVGSSKLPRRNASDWAPEVESKIADDSVEWRTLRNGAELGMYLFIGSTIQLQALRLTSATEAGFLVQLTTVIVPAIEALLGRRVSGRVWAATVCAFVGVALLALDGASTAGAGGDVQAAALTGDALVVLAAFFYSAHVIRLGRIASESSALPLALCKAGTQLCAAAAGVGLVMASGGAPAEDVASFLEWAGEAGGTEELRTILFVLLWNGAAVSAAVTWAQSFGQRRVPSATASVLYSTQPLFSAAIAYAVLGETVGPAGGVGCGAVVAAIALAVSEQFRGLPGVEAETERG